MQRTTVFLTDEQVKALRNMSKTTGLKLSELLRRAVDAYLKESK